MINSQVIPCVAISVTQYDQRIATQNWSKASNFLPDLIATRTHPLYMLEKNSGFWFIPDI